MCVEGACVSVCVTTETETDEVRETTRPETETEEGTNGER